MSTSERHIPRKRFGQNFLQDQQVISQIITAISPKKDDLMVEIGPGLGALTKPLLKAVDVLNVVEIDRDIIARLKAEKNPHLMIHEGDALKFDFSSLKKQARKIRAVGNLPYNISTPILFHLMQYEHIIEDMHFMLQKEVVDRICASVGTKAYGRLSVMIQYYCRVDHLFLVPPESFYPAPKVDSAIVRLTPHKSRSSLAKDINQLEKVVKAAFQQRRKTLRNTLKGLLTEAQMIELGIDPRKRPEQITLAEFVSLSNELSRA